MQIKDDITIATLGLKSEMNDFIIKKVVQYFPETHIAISCFSEQEYLNGKVSRKEFDVYIINDELEKIDVIEAISNFKERFPLSEIILVTAKKDFDHAISSFRAGIRDILEYPFKEVPLVLSIKKSLHYRQMLNHSASLTKIMSIFNVFNELRNFENESEFFIKINNIVTQSNLLLPAQSASKISPLMVIKFPSNFILSSNSKSTYSVYWHRRAFIQNYRKKEFFDLVGKLKDSGFFKGHHSLNIINHEGRKNFFINLGEHEKNTYCGIFCTEDHKKNVKIEREHWSFFANLLQSAFQQLLLAQNSEKISGLIYCDDVTGLYNQRKLKKDLDKFILESRRNTIGFAVIFIDIDHFKSVNDNHGHQTGGVILVEMARELQKVVRETDYIYRYGGDEFVIIIPNTDADLATRIGERLLKAVQKRTFSTFDEEEEMKLSISIGVAHYPTHASNHEEIIKVADELMYSAKKGGRGMVCTVDKILHKKGA